MDKTKRDNSGAERDSGTSRARVRYFVPMSRDEKRPAGHAGRDNGTPGLGPVVPFSRPGPDAFKQDKRFGAWLAAMPGPSEPDADALQRQDEQRELMRVAAQRVLDNAKSGRMVFHETLAWAEHVVATTPPLGRPLGTGEPAAGCTICGSPSHTRSHCPMATEDL